MATGAPKAGAPAPAASLVIFGGAGDLSRRLLMPAIVNLTRDGLIGDDLDILIVSHGEGSDKAIRKQLTEHLALKDKGIKAAWKKREPRIRYFQGAFDQRADFERLADTLKRADNIAFYLASAASFFAPIAENLAAVGLLKEEGGFRRLVIEKPFGHDLASAQALNRTLLAAMDERQIFRIDHFLGKETVQNILTTRFGNAFFEAVWNARYIDYVEISAAETVDVGTRGGFYDATGALRDMVPNHLFQLLAMIGMEAPNSFDAEAVRDEKAKLLQAVRIPTKAEARREAVRGQYGAGRIGDTKIGAYHQAAKVAPDSATETYVALKLMVDSWRWAGVPFYLRTGKAMAARATEIVLHFKPIPLTLFRDVDVGGLPPNRLTIRIQPDEGICLDFVAKKPGPVVDTAPVRMRFAYADAFNLPPSTGYESLIYDMLIGDPALFQRADMVERGWAIVQPILDHWAKGGAPEPYDPGSQGPEAADALLARDGHGWTPVA
ncbi:glucose-6-phosphate dehydrogenase [Sphingomonas morindae]|uniref:Glucose-6-phosphate 1-dehydrogenase n=1 Tax=Sphingomonas morindae TaxID=1541170 RepID=A0ABY4X694_9SPHN|nr:glucose-6-phosphate dehydrogenase [Sphingomonas morindae]USI72417.1 glucose-6-phosphate dehydrogenase [Sphingomonas morindae]